MGRLHRRSMAAIASVWILWLIAYVERCFAGYVLNDSFAGASFFDQFDFFTVRP